MAKPAIGELRPLADGWEARVRIDDEGNRKGFALTAIPKIDEAAARERCTAMARIALALRKAGHAAELPELLSMAARARAGKPWAAILVAVDALTTPGGTSPLTSASAPITFVDFAREWTDGKLHKKWPDHVPAKESEADARMLRLYVEPVIRDVAVADFSLDHAEQIMANLPPRLATASRRQVAQFVRRVCALAVYPARLRAEVPVPRGWMPKVKLTRAFTYLYPDEDRALLLSSAGSDEGPGVPLIRRLFFGVLSREGLRREELASLRWRDLDLDKGHIALDRNKTDDPRSWALDPGVTRALAAWRDRYCADSEPDHPVFGEKGCAIYVGHMAEELRADLTTAGVKREALFERSDARRPIRVHDLRATFVTVSLANGKTETWVCDRTGHRSSEMVNRYRRAARTWAELNLGALAPLDECIPELRPLPHGLPHNVRGPSEGGGEKRKRISGEGEIRTRGTLARPHDFQSPQATDDRRDELKNRAGDDPEQPEMTRDATPVGQSWGDGDPVEAALAKALEGATAAGRWDVVAQLARELEARRLGQGSNVVPLAFAARRR
jgi:integrase